MSDDDKMYFSDRIAEHAAGWLDRRATEELNELLKAVKITGKPGEITVRLKVTPRQKGDGDVAVIFPEIKSKVPKQGVDAEVVRIFDDGDMEVLSINGEEDDGLGDDPAPRDDLAERRKKRGQR